MLENSIIIKIILIPALHFLFSILLLGTGWLAILQEKLTGKNIPSPGNFLIAVSLGILHNTLQFGLVLLLYRKFPVNFQAMLSVGKYAMDLAFLLFIFLVHPKKYLGLLKQLPSVFSGRGNAFLLLLSMLMGWLAIMNFPHVHDSGQLMATNHMLQNGSDFLPAGRLGLGFSALCYFPAALFKSIPMGTLAAGYKFFILFLTGLAVIYGIDKMGLVYPLTGKYLLFTIFLSSFFGLYGIMELGKDSAWSVLFSIVFIFSLFARSRGQKIGESLVYLLSAMAMGMIGIPYLLFFCAIWALLHFLPDKISSHKMLLPASVILLLGCSAMLMPLKVAIPAQPHLQPFYGKFVYWPPTDGKTSFFHYFFAHEKFAYRNSVPIVIAGLLSIFLLPWVRKRFRDAAIRSTALFLPITTLSSLLLAFQARNFYPTSRAQKIPLTPFSTFEVWNLVKDIPQWYVQVISGVLTVIALDAWIREIPLKRQARRGIFIGSALLTALVALSANFSQVVALKNTAHFYRYGGNKNDSFARVMEIIQRHPDVNRIFLESGLPALNANFFFFDIQNYFPAKVVCIVPAAASDKIPSQITEEPALLILKTDSYSKLKAKMKRRNPFTISTLGGLPETAAGMYKIARTGKINKTVRFKKLRRARAMNGKW